MKVSQFEKSRICLQPIQINFASLATKLATITYFLQVQSIKKRAADSSPFLCFPNP